jgi:ABC-type nitrate/sulfonate/bicarbonate transport system substrate-binding protein
LITPFELIAQKLGLRLLQSARELFPRYQGLVGATRRSWAAANGAVLTDFIRAHLESLAWLHDRANKAAAAAILVEKVPNMSAELAAATYDELLKLPGGFEPKAKIDPEGMKAVLALRSEYGHPQKTLTDPMKYVDLSYYERAAR